MKYTDKIIIMSLLIVLSFPAVGLAEPRSFISQYGITWAFDGDHETGQFANGDWWVVGPVNIIGIDPVSTRTLEDGEVVVRHGSITNLDATDGDVQGFDSRLSSWNEDYNAARPGGDDLSFGNPLELPKGTSLISCRSRMERGSWTTKNMQLLDVAVLTVLGDIPLEGSFRPAYYGQDKTVRFTVDGIDYTKLKNHPLIEDGPRLKKEEGDKIYDSLERTFERVWLDYLSGASGSYNHPENNLPPDGAWLTREMSNAGILLNSNYSVEDKRKLAISLIQLGIDNYGIIKAGKIGSWTCDGQIAPGRKFPILFAGLMLDDEDMKSIGDKSGDYLYENGSAGNEPEDYIHFGEDDQTFYVKESDIYEPPLLSWHGSMYAQTSNGASRIKVSRDTDGRLTKVTRDEGSWGGWGIGYYHNIVIKLSPGSGDNIEDWVPGIDLNYTIAQGPEDGSNILILQDEFTGEEGISYDYKAGYTPFVYGHGDQWDYDEYTQEHIGLPEWGIRHSRNPGTDGFNWDAPYRYQAGWWGFVLAAHMMGMKELWNHDALFDYMDRFMKIELGWSISAWIRGNWNAYRGEYAPVWDGTSTPQDPTDPRDPQDPSDPQNPTDPGEPDTQPFADPIPEAFNLAIHNNVIKPGNNNQVAIICDLKEAGVLKVIVYDAKGKEIKILCNEYREAQRHTDITWNATDGSGNVVGSGIYMVHMKSGSYSKTAKIAIIK